MKNVVLSFVAVTLLPLVMSSTVLAKTSKKKVMSPVEYYKTLLWKQDKLFTTPVGKVTAFHKKPEHCEEETPVDKLSCLKVACKYSGDCHHDHYLEEIAQWCKGDADGDCIETMCDYSGDCHHDHYLEKIVKSCGN